VKLFFYFTGAMLDVRCLPAFGGARGDQGSMFVFSSKPSTVLPAKKICYSRLQRSRILNTLAIEI